MRAHRWYGRPAVMLLALAGLLGCWSNVPPGSPEFAQGYAEGCDTGYSDAGWELYDTHRLKDPEAYARQGDYRRGWDAGHKKCYDEELTSPHMSRTGGGAHI